MKRLEEEWKRKQRKKKDEAYQSDEDCRETRVGKGKDMRWPREVSGNVYAEADTDRSEQKQRQRTK